MLTDRTDVRYFSRLLRAPKDSYLTGLIDYTYTPLALGDTFTSLVKMTILARQKKVDRLRIYICFDGKGHCFKQQHIDETNYRAHISSILPAFRFSPIPSTLHVYRSPTDMQAVFFSKHLTRQAAWPPLRNHATRQPDYYSHFDILDFFNEYGFVPHLATPPEYIQRREQFSRRLFPGKFLVTVNIRQRLLMDNFAALYRDSSIPEWYRFFDIVSQKYPDVVFLNIGGYAEWERTLGHKKNVFISRVEGMGLGDEIAFLQSSNLYMGSSSGFSAAATFSATPYVITHVDPAFAPYFGIRVGTDHPFASANQTLSWVPETTDLLLSLFEEKYKVLR